MAIVFRTCESHSITKDSIWVYLICSAWSLVSRQQKQLPTSYIITKASYFDSKLRMLSLIKK
jgi:hypothetical protein